MQRRFRSVVYALCCALLLVTTTVAQEEKRSAPPKEIIEANNRFALKLLKQAFAASPNKNIIISPLSLSYSFGLLQNGASPAARKEMADVFEFGSMTPQQVNTGMRDLFRDLTRYNFTYNKNDGGMNWIKKGTKIEPFRLSVGLWIRGNEAYRSDFLKTSSTYYGAALKALPTNDRAAVAAMNRYAARYSGGRFTTIVNSIGKEKFMLTSSAHTECSWGLPFERSEMFTNVFHAAAGERRVELISKLESFAYGKAKSFETVSEGCLHIFLPDRNSGLAETIAQLNWETWSEWYSNLHQRRSKPMVLVLPKLKLEAKHDPLSLLQEMGLKLPFSGSSGLNKMLVNPAGAKLTRIIQRSFMTLDEHALTLGSVSYMGGTPGGMYGPGEPPKVLLVDRPFAFVVTESNGSVVYVGTVVDPEGTAD